MKILKYTKLKNNKYRVDFDQCSLEIYDDLILKYELLLKKKITEEEFTKLKDENTSLAGYYLALNYLNSKMRTKKEIKEYLKRKEIPEPFILEAILKLENLGYLNDTKYVNFYINDSLKFSKDGPNKIKQKLKDLGISESIIDEALSSIHSSVFKEKMEKLVSKKIEANHSDSEATLKNKLFRYLLSCGYSKEMILNYLDSIVIPKDEKILYKEKEKLIRKLSRKYEGEALKFQLRNKLYQKGFSKEEIDEVI